MAHPAPSSAAPVTEEAFLADRQKFWSAFCGFTTWSTGLMIVLLALMAIFLV